MKDTTETPMVFRVWPNGDVIALMPTLPYAVGGYCCQSYEHVGQHGAADYTGVVRATKLATAAEYADLLAELTGRGYNVRPVKRAPKPISEPATAPEPVYIRHNYSGPNNAECAFCGQQLSPGDLAFKLADAIVCSRECATFHTQPRPVPTITA